MKMCENLKFIDILEPRNTQFGIFKFMTRPWVPKKILIGDTQCTPQELKEIAACSTYLESYIEAESVKHGVPKELLEKEVKKYLEEIGFDKKMHVIRWMGIVFLKISFMMKTGIYVNEQAILKLKDQMGKNPVLFLPTHRSYADFCVLTYLCYHYDIELPAVAAGMDFYSMAVVGQRMRETGAFYIRRTISGDHLYAATLKQYVRTLVSNSTAPVEFFVEGTRSRSNKSLPPKYGILSMSLVPYFAGEVSDITIVPVNLSYDRIMEQTLFAYEHIGVPKPKESTGGLLKALRTLNDHFGNIYVNFGEPMSLREYLKGDNMVTGEMLKPHSLHQLTADQLTRVKDVAHEVVSLQQKSAIATISNLIAFVLMDSYLRNEALIYERFIAEVEWMVGVLRGLGASVYEDDVKKSVDRILVVHHKMVAQDRDRRIKLVTGDPVEVTSELGKKMKGHTLKSETMVNAVPVIQIQIYVNPLLHYVVPPALVYLLVKRGDTTRDQLANDYHRLRKVLKHEFFHIERREEDIFDAAIKYCIRNDVIKSEKGILGKGNSEKLQFLLNWSVLPSLTIFKLCIDVIAEKKHCEITKLLKIIQQQAEEKGHHPYCLSLEATSNCLQGLVLDGVVRQRKTEKPGTYYDVVPSAMDRARRLLDSVILTQPPGLNLGEANVVYSRRPRLTSRL